MLTIRHVMFALVNSNIFRGARCFLKRHEEGEKRNRMNRYVRQKKIFPRFSPREKEKFQKGKRCVKAAHFLPRSSSSEHKNCFFLCSTHTGKPTVESSTNTGKRKLLMEEERAEEKERKMFRVYFCLCLRFFVFIFLRNLWIEQSSDSPFHTTMIAYRTALRAMFGTNMKFGGHTNSWPQNKLHTLN